MNEENINTDIYKGGYFVLNNKRKQDLTFSSNDLQVTLENNDNLKLEIINLIRNASETIKLCSFILTDEEIYSELENVLKSKDVSLFILTQLDRSKLSASFLSDEELIENFHQTHLDIVGKLYRLGAHIRAAKSAHAKFIIADRNYGILMSANITTPSLNQNPESGVVIQKNSTVVALERVFDIIFQHGTEFTSFRSASKNKQFVVERTIDLKDEWLVDIKDDNLRFTWNDAVDSLYGEILNILEQQDEEILMSTYSVVGLEHIPEVLDKISSFIQHGGRIKLMCRGMNYRPDHLKNCTLLAKKGVEIYGDLYNHSKGIVKGQDGVIFTANIDGNHGLINGFEVGVKLESKQTNAMRSFINWQINTADYQFMLNPAKSLVHETYDYYIRKKNINGLETINHLILKLPVNHSFDSKELAEFPIYGLVNPAKEIEFINVGSKYYSASMSQNIIRIKERVNRVSNKESYFLKYNRITIDG